ncbi:acyltransferase family protein [Streptomyces sp. A7024]|uniref:Acyltransferase family protein n=1 Tax=Streptomyces coryli TaxID=1128680 RepID=A0A6G4U214_9ACTN|nr:acyltransferase family protein [Streptomyces coryli]NGN65746.1 acyltransferase family protein [Streptomyces coryli]
MSHVVAERPPLYPDLPSAYPGAFGSSAPLAGGGPPESGGKGQGRDPFLDNAKYLTIILVVLGHTWAPMVHGSRTTAAAYMLLYSFHMPAFIIVSGYLSRTFTGSPRQLQRLVTGVLVPYVVLQTALTLFMRVIDNPEREFRYQDPGFALWFLVALFLWRLTTPLWNRLRWPVPVTLAIAVAASVTPTMSDSSLNLMRVAQFLPFFVLGLQLRPEHFEVLKRPSARLIAAPVMCMGLVVAYLAVPRMSAGWFLHNYASQTLGAPAWAGAVMTLAIFGCGVVMTACFLAWVPRRRLWMTALGAGTLYAYLLHIFPVQMSRHLGWYDAGWIRGPVGHAAISVIAMVLMTLLCTGPVQRALRPVLEPKMTWFFQRERRRGAHARRR